jgi:hypothetical protein
MDIKDILDNLGLDLTNPEVKRGAIEAITAILDSRKPSDPSIGSPSSSNGSDVEDVEIDPDLIQPSIKNQPPSLSNNDVEIEDEENILDQIKHNDSDIDSSNNSSGGTDNSSSQSSNSEKSESDLDISSDGSKQNDSSVPQEEGGENADSDSQSNSNVEDADQVDSDEEEPGTTDQSAPGDNKDESSDQLTGAGEGDEYSNDLADDEDSTVSDDDSFDEEDLIDSGLKDTFEDEAIKAKHEARKIKRERTILAAKKALDRAKTNKASKSLINELESALRALEELSEAVAKNIKDISDDEFNMLINRVFDAIDAIGGSDLTYTTDEERELKAQEIKADISSAKTQQELSAEDIAQIRAETQAIKAREKEANKYKTRARGSFKGFKDFLNSLYRAIALQVATEENREDTWSAINRRHSGSGVLQPGKKVDELPNRKIPVIDFYFDQSGSWSDRDVAVGQKAVNQLVEMEENGQIKINIFYFANNVFSNAEDARVQGGTRAWNDIVRNVIATQATNVIIMTDHDMEDWWSGPKALSYTVPGYVWYLWRDGDNAPRLPRDLKGRGGTQQFSFNAADI